MRSKLAFSFCLTVFLMTAALSLAEDCEFSAARAGSVDAAGASRIVIAAAAGSLFVEGQAGLSRVEARGEACASSEELLEGIRILTERSGDEVRIVAEIPDPSGRDSRSSKARLDLMIEVPADVPLRIEDSSGGMELRGVAQTEIDDSSGEILVENLEGDLSIRDGSGGIGVRQVRGSVMVEEDGSGSIEIAEVDLDVRIDEDGSGSIWVSDVGGDFTVRRDGSGGIDYQRVGGQVEVPRRHSREEP